MQLEGKFKKSIYKTPEKGTGIAVYEMKGNEEEDVVVTGYMLPTIKNVTYIFEGKWVNHPKYGKQFQAESYTEDVTDTDGIIRYLSSGVIKGIGLKTATRIVKTFGLDTLDVMDNDIDRLKSVKGISSKTLKKIMVSYEESKKSREVILYLTSKGISPRLAQKVHEKYGDNAMDVIRNTPYKISSIRGIPFTTADQMGDRTAEYEMSFDRFMACARYVLYANELCEFQDIIGKRTSGSLGMDKDDFGMVMLTLLRINQMTGAHVCEFTIRALKEGLLQKKTNENGVMMIYLPGIFRIEKATAEHIWRIASNKSNYIKNISDKIAAIEFESGIKLGEDQRKAVETYGVNNLSLIIGPPGSGKTTTINTIAKLYASECDGDIYLLAPSGKASSRIKETTDPSMNMHISTVHSGIEIGTETINDVEEEEIKFSDCLIVVDEMSMLDARTAYRLFSCIDESCKVVICGDDEQLQSVAAGAVLRDMINSGVLPVTVLKRIYRQAAGGAIYDNAYKIREGDTDLSWGDDFHMEEISDTQELEDRMIKLYLQKIKEYGPENVMLLSPFRGHNAGVDNLNKRIQSILRPEDKYTDIKYGDQTFRIGDVVMQLKNDKENDVMNGDVGIITNIHKSEDEIAVIVNFANSSKIYDKDNIDELCLAYAYTVHKSQGSEAKCVIVCAHKMHSVMLKRNVYYTAITRAKEEVCVLGQKSSFMEALRTVDKSKRNTSLEVLLKAQFEQFSKIR